MPLKGDVFGVAKLRNSMKRLAAKNGREWKLIQGNVYGTVMDLVREEFKKGIDPSGAAWKLTKRGRRQPLMSRKIPASIHHHSTTDGLFFFSYVIWLGAHQDGHVWPAGGHHMMTVSKAGKMLRTRGRVEKYIGADGKTHSKKEPRVIKQKSVFDVKAHHLHARVLPPRPIVPNGAMPLRWFRPIAEVISEAWKRCGTEVL